MGGYNNFNLYLTLNVNYTYNSYNTARWTPAIPKSGRYKVEAYIGHHGSIRFSCPNVTVSQNTSKARHTIHYYGGKTTVVANQGTLDNAWVELGSYYFAAGKNDYVLLSEVIGESDLSLLINFNVLRFTWVGP
jgi:hypothetical protein